MEGYNQHSFAKTYSFQNRDPTRSNSNYRYTSDRHTATNHLTPGHRALFSTELSPYNSRSTSPRTTSPSGNLHQDNERRNTSGESTESRNTRTSSGQSSKRTDIKEIFRLVKRLQSINLDDIEKEIEENTLTNAPARKGSKQEDEGILNQLQQLKDKCLALEETNESYTRKCQQAVDDKAESEEKLKNLTEEYKNKMKKIKYLERVVSEKDQELNRVVKDKDQEIKQMQLEKDSALSRLSKEMGEKLHKENTAIADLSDPNRSTKVAELYNSIYDNEWTDALETLQTCGLDEEHAVRTLLEIIRSIYDFCGKAKEDHLEQLEKHLFNPISQRQAWSQENNPTTNIQKQIRSLLMDCIKLGAKDMIPSLKSNYSSIKHKPGYSERIPEYVEKAIKLCWLMHMSNPPLVFGKQLQTGDSLDKNLYKEYTKQGDIVSFVVWLPLLIEKDGAVLTKGVAQPIPSVSKQTKSIGTERLKKNKDSFDNKTDRQYRDNKENKNDVLSQFFESGQSGSRVHTGRYADTELGTKESLYGRDHEKFETGLENNKPSHRTDFSKTFTSTTKFERERKPMSEFLKSVSDKFHDKDQSDYHKYTTNDIRGADDESFRNRDTATGSYKDYKNYTSSNIQSQRQTSEDHHSRHTKKHSTSTAIDGVEYRYHNGKLIMRMSPLSDWKYVQTGHFGSTDA